MSPPDVAPSKDHTGENFPVASFIIAARHRPAILGFYRFARQADDIADAEGVSAADRLAGLSRMRAGLEGADDGDAASLRLRAILAERGLTADHAFDLLTAFERDVRQTRYADWDDLMDYCRWSAMPVGRFVLDVHGEDRGLWPASDALCAALQVINHLQDCAKDRRALDRVYLPGDALAAAGVGVEALDAPSSSPALLGVIRGAADGAARLLDTARPFAAGIRDGRLAYEVAFIQRLAEDLVGKLLTRDPLCERVHHTRAEMLWLAIRAGLDRLSPSGRTDGAGRRRA